MSEWLKETVSKTVGAQASHRFESYRLRRGRGSAICEANWVCYPTLTAFRCKLYYMKREFSAGGIVFNNEGKVLITKHSQNHHWGFPKGWIDEGESLEETAIREVREEGGVEAEIIDKAGYTKYMHTFNGEKIFKVVTYFLMKYISGDPKDHDWEMEDAGWFEVEEALKTLSFARDKDLLNKALEMKGMSS